MKTTNRLLALLLALIMIISCAPLSIFATETGDSAIAKLSPVADTYVSDLAPDKAFGDVNKLILSGADNVNIVFISYSSDVFDSEDDIKLVLPALSENTCVDAQVFVLYGTFEEGVTYKTMSKLDEEAVYTIDSVILEGSNPTVDITAARGKVTDEYFTIALRSNYEDHYYYEDFESLVIGTSFKEITKVPKTSGGTDYVGCYVDDTTILTDDFAFNLGGSGSKMTWIATVEEGNEKNTILEIYE